MRVFGSDDLRGSTHLPAATTQPATGATSAATAAPAAADLGLSAPAGGAAPASPKDEFLRLLVAQLQYQDPLEPQSGADFVAQLAQFASLEQSAETNERLAVLAADQASASRTALAGLVGREVRARADTIALDAAGAGHPIDLRARLDAPAARVEVVIQDAEGRPVRTIDLGARAAGEVPVGWDGKDVAGNPLPPGSYRVEVHATAADGAAVSAHAELAGIIEAMRLEDGEARFLLGGCAVAPGAIVSVT